MGAYTEIINFSGKYGPKHFNHSGAGTTGYIDPTTGEFKGRFAKIITNVTLSGTQVSTTDIELVDAANVAVISLRDIDSLLIADGNALTNQKPYHAGYAVKINQKVTPSATFGILDFAFHGTSNNELKMWKILPRCIIIAGGGCYNAQQLQGSAGNYYTLQVVSLG